ncbi:hypothetical protein QOT17_002794 [Balamuthia mandrillaris]
MKGCKDRPPCCWFCIVFTLEGEHEQEWRERDKQSSGSLPSDNIFLGFLFAIHRFYLSPFASLGAYQQEYSKLAVALAKGTTVPQKLRDLFSQGYPRLNGTRANPTFNTFSSVHAFMHTVRKEQGRSVSRRRERFVIF